MFDKFARTFSFPSFSTRRSSWTSFELQPSNVFWWNLRSFHELTCALNLWLYKIISSIFLLIIFVCKALSSSKHSCFYCVPVWIDTFCNLHSHSVSLLFDAVLTCSPIPKHCVCQNSCVLCPKQAAWWWSGRLFGMNKIPISFMASLWVICLKFKGTKSVSQQYWN